MEISTLLLIQILLIQKQAGELNRNDGIFHIPLSWRTCMITNIIPVLVTLTRLAFSPDNRHMYISYQSNGVVYDITREDGYPFGAHRLDIKYHAN